MQGVQMMGAWSAASTANVSRVAQLLDPAARSRECPSARSSRAPGRAFRGRGGRGCVAKASSTVPPRRVGIVGGGPAGLALAHALLTLDSGAEEVKVFEQYAELKPTVGAGFNINGGAIMLQRLGLTEDLKEICNPMKSVIARTVGGDELFSVDVAAVAPPSLTCADGTPAFYTVMRSDLQRVLERRLPEGVVTLSSKVTGVRQMGSGVRVEFADGALSDEFDLLVGCDGIRSVVRAEVTGGRTTAPTYSGIRILFAVAERGTYPKADGELQQWFGDGAYALVYSGGLGAGQKDMLALCVADDQQAARLGENENWEEGDTQAECIDILKRTGMPAEVVRLAETSERIFDIGVHYHDTLGKWTCDDNVVLLGDSAHAMPPFMGQGANQAMQDAYCLASNLGQVGGEFGTVADALRAYERARIPPTAAIMQISRLNGWLETQGGIGAPLRDLLFKILGALGIPAQIFLQNSVPRV